MIVIDNQIARMAVENAIASGRVTKNSLPKAWLLQALIQLDFTFEVRRNPALLIPKGSTLEAWSSAEIAAAEVVTWMLAYLDRIGCKGIERLLQDVTAYRAKHPDRPGQSPWPHRKGER